VEPLRDLIREMVTAHSPPTEDSLLACAGIAARREFHILGAACLEEMLALGMRPDGRAFNPVVRCVRLSCQE
jgi:hypothetical protein